MEDASEETTFYLLDVSMNRRTNSNDTFSLHLYGKTFKNGEWQDCCIRTIDTKTVTAILDPQDNLKALFPSELHGFKVVKGVQVLWVFSEERRFMKEFYSDAESLNNKPKVKLRLLRSDAHKFISYARDPGFKTIQRIYDSKFPSLDEFLIHQNIRGSCFLTIRDKMEPKLRGSYCQQEYTAANGNIVPMSGPNSIPDFPFTIWNLTLYIDPSRNQICWICCQIISTNFNDFYLFGKTNDIRYHHILNCEILDKEALKSFLHGEKAFFYCKNSERELLQQFLSLGRADAWIGYHLFERDIYQIFRRAFHYGLDVRTLGRLREIEAAKIDDHLKDPQRRNNFDPTIILPGVIIFDLKHCSQEFFPKSEIFSFQAWRKTYAQKRANDSQETENPIKYYHSLLDDQLEVFVREKWFAITHKIAEKSGLPWKWVLMKPEMLRAEFLLNHAFHQALYILPSRERKIKDSSHPNEKVIGGINLAPKPGLYSGTIVLLDGKNLYPSCVVEHGLCLESTNPVLPNVFKDLISEKQDIEERIHHLGSDNENERNNLVSLRTAIKFILNKTYGCFASPLFPFSCNRLANQITEKGRDFLNTILKHLKENHSDCSVLFGVTDSVCILLPQDSQQPEEKIQAILTGLNGEFRTIRIKHESTFTKILVSSNKNEYAALCPGNQTPENMVCKGFGQAQPLDLKTPIVFSKALKQFLFETLTSGSPSSTEALIESHLNQFRVHSAQVPLFEFATHIHLYNSRKNGYHNNPTLMNLIHNQTKQHPNAAVLSYLSCKSNGRTCLLSVEEAQRGKNKPDLELYEKNLRNMLHKIAAILKTRAASMIFTSAATSKKPKLTQKEEEEVKLLPISSYKEIAQLFNDEEESSSPLAQKTNSKVFICCNCGLKQIQQSACINQLCKQ